MGVGHDLARRRSGCYLCVSAGVRMRPGNQDGRLRDTPQRKPPISTSRGRRGEEVDVTFKDCGPAAVAGAAAACWHLERPGWRENTGGNRESGKTLSSSAPTLFLLAQCNKTKTAFVWYRGKPIGQPLACV